MLKAKLVINVSYKDKQKLNLTGSVCLSEGKCHLSEWKSMFALCNYGQKKMATCTVKTSGAPLFNIVGNIPLRAERNPHCSQRGISGRVDGPLRSLRRLTLPAVFCFWQETRLKEGIVRLQPQEEPLRSELLSGKFTVLVRMGVIPEMEWSILMEGGAPLLVL